jgi:acylphosphatase
MFAKHVFYSGNVQGVGFRFTTKQIATGFEVTGWVRNLPDGRVEMRVMALDGEELDQFLEEVAVNSSLAGHIREVAVADGEPVEGVQGFSILG